MVIQVYAPTTIAEEAKVKQFYDNTPQKNTASF